MSTIPTENHLPSRSQNVTVQRLVASREEVILLSHLIQASLVERNNPIRQTITAHRSLVRGVLVALVIVLSVAFGLLAPAVSHALGM